MRFWLGPWVWDGSDPSAPTWKQPTASVAALDFRSIPQCAATVTPQGVGLFITPNAANLGSSYENLGTDLQLTLTAQQSNRLRSLLALPDPITAPRLGGALWEALTRQADPTGDDRAKPILPNMAREYVLAIAGERVFTQKFRGDEDEARPVLDLLKRDYRRLRQDCLDGRSPPLHFRKALGFWVRKYRLPADWFRPADLPADHDLPPETTFTESWPTDSLDISTGQDQVWTEVLGDCDVSGGLLKGTSGNTEKRVRCETALSGADHYCQATITHITGANASRAVAVDNRFDASADTCYRYRIRGMSGGESIEKCIVGTLTVLTSGARTGAAGNTMYIEANGSSLEAKYAGSTALTVTDSSITTGVRIGCGGNGQGSVWGLDDIEAADLAATGGILYTQLERGVRGVLRGVYTRF